MNCRRVTVDYRMLLMGLVISVVCGVPAARMLADRPDRLSADPLCVGGVGLPAGFAPGDLAGMVHLPAGQIQLGSLAGYPDERPAGGPVRVPAFWMDRTEVTNAQFARFVEATGYVTEAEREGAAAVFRPLPPGKAPQRDGEWWHWVKGANWRQPEGPASAVRAQPNEPVVMVTYQDAMVYARWLGRDLPTEAEWEYAAAGGGSPELIDREPRDVKGRTVANYWQGVFPDINVKEDGYAALAPVGCYAANGFGLVDMIGNVWEFTRDPYTGAHQEHGNGDIRPSLVEAGALTRSGAPLVIKGGSFLCASNYCQRYRAAARHPHEADMATSHVGFRTVFRP